MDFLNYQIFLSQKHQMHRKMKTVKFKRISLSRLFRVFIVQFMTLGSHYARTHKKIGAFLRNYNELVNDDFMYYVDLQEGCSKKETYAPSLKNNVGMGLQIKALGQVINLSTWSVTQTQIETDNRIEELT